MWRNERIWTRLISEASLQLIKEISFRRTRLREGHFRIYLAYGCVSKSPALDVDFIQFWYENEWVLESMELAFWSIPANMTLV